MFGINWGWEHHRFKTHWPIALPRLASRFLVVRASVVVAIHHRVFTVIALWCHWEKNRHADASYASRGRVGRGEELGLFPLVASCSCSGIRPSLHNVETGFKVSLYKQVWRHSLKRGFTLLVFFSGSCWWRINGVELTQRNVANHQQQRNEYNLSHVVCCLVTLVQKCFLNNYCYLLYDAVRPVCGWLPGVGLKYRGTNIPTRL